MLSKLTLFSTRKHAHLLASSRCCDTLTYFRPMAVKKPHWKYFPGHKKSLLGPVYTGPNKFLHFQKLARFLLAFTWDRRNWTDFWTAKCASLGPEFFRSQTWTLSRSNICPVKPVPCKRKVEPYKFLPVQKFFWTRVNAALSAYNSFDIFDPVFASRAFFQESHNKLVFDIINSRCGSPIVMSFLRFDNNL